MLDIREPDIPRPPPVAVRPERDATAAHDAERLAASLEGVLSTKVPDDTISA
ncbi:hypothetical protein [uncultured Methylobacterium sp.]|jgi:hypothetical protein|uniref:hypothetical protein n=1 Tax=uncultured Methylobacterium sp. TaxID=157278 RepID=UPI0026217A6E|nr:hypothetical protein [uncultured Methylobacterium sp.]